jgi:hypothetical protein
MTESEKIERQEREQRSRNDGRNQDAEMKPEEESDRKTGMIRESGLTDGKRILRLWESRQWSAMDVTCHIRSGSNGNLLCIW